ncbi:MAG TPA: MurR/RpiR family transcriptional regulator [Microthrixaceae bacterium]|nr:MurR/RpiR family transcriptional regulator [Microthrixaceae bacterium]
MAVASLSPAQRRVADLLTDDPQALAFGTVASVAERAGTSAPTVVRLANTLGFDGFAELRDTAREELTERIRTDALRVNIPAPTDPLDALITIEQANVVDTVARVDHHTLTAVIDLLSDRSRRIFVLPSTQTDGVARRFVDQLNIVRGRALLLDGTEFRVASTLQALRSGDVILSMDVPRHEAALVRTQAQAVDAGGVPVVLSGDAPVSLRTRNGHLLTFARESVGPFDSLVGLTVLATLLVNAVVERRREDAGRRVLELERTWTDGGLFQI